MTSLSDDKSSGKIKLILGPMFSGKSTRLIETINKYRFKDLKVIMVKHTFDQRYTTTSEVVTHDKLSYKSESCCSLSEKINILKEYDVIGIDEGQFFSDLVEVSDELCSLGKIIVIAALSGDFRMEPFPVISRIISKSDKITLMKAYCFNCHKEAGFSLRIVDSEEKFLIGSGESYKPVCKSCHIYFTENQKKEKKEKELQKEIETIEEKKKNSKKEEIDLVKKDEKENFDLRNINNPSPLKKENLVI